MSSDAAGVRWRSWSRFEWSDALLDHYFRRAADRDGPVRVVVATGDELADATGDPDADPEEVTASLTRTVLNAVGDKNYWRHAESGMSGSRPVYVAHLVVACLVAVDLSDLDERSYIDRLVSELGPGGGRHLEVMAKLWSHLDEWLRERPREFRPLVLPDPKGWTRIGHTMRLAFPSRQDQVRLFKVLSNDGLLLDNPPVAAVKATIAGKIGGFSKRFGEEFDDFGRLFDDSVQVDELMATPLWDAVQAVVRLSLRGTGETARQRWTLLGEDDGFDLDLQVVTDQAGGTGDRQTVESSYLPPPWRYELYGDDAVAAVLTGQIGGAGSLSNVAAGGLIPMAPGLHLDLEVAPRASYAEVYCLLVRDDLVEAAVAEFGGVPGELGVAGWSVVRDCRLSLLDPADLLGTALERCWVVHDSPFPRSIRWLGGTKLEGGFLSGRRLPSIQADGAVSALIEFEDKVEALHGDHGIFRIPDGLIPESWSGHAQILVDFGEEIRLKSLLLSPAPAHERYKWPNEHRAWLMEGLGRSDALVSSMTGSDVSAEWDFVDQVQYLSPIVGGTSAGPSDAAWEVLRFGDHVIARTCGQSEDLEPSAQCPDARPRRVWRKTLQAALIVDDRDRAARSKAIATTGLVEDRNVKPLVDPIRHVGVVDQRLAGLVETVASIANRRTGVTTKQFLDLCDEQLGLVGPLAWHVLRSWKESGALVDAVNRRWSNRKLFVRIPELQIFRTERFFGARVHGLPLESTLRRVEDAASSRCVFADRQQSELGLTPESVVLRATNEEALRETAKAAGLASRLVDPLVWRLDGGPDGRRELPANYQRTGRQLSDPQWDGAVLQRWSRPDAPRYWEAVYERHSIWAYHRDVAQLWACALSGAPIVQRNQARLDVAGSYLPLPTACQLNAVAPVVAGPTTSGGYAYHCPTEEYAKRIVDGMTRFIDSTITELTEAL